VCWNSRNIGPTIAPVVPVTANSPFMYSFIPSLHDVPSYVAKTCVHIQRGTLQAADTTVKHAATIPISNVAVLQL